MSKLHWIANTAKKQPVADEVLVDVLFKDNGIEEGLRAGIWGPAEYDSDNWWEVSSDCPNNFIIAWRFSTQA